MIPAVAFGLGAATAVLAVSLYLRRQAIQALRASFPAAPELGAFRDALPRASLGGRHRHAVLLLHGFSTSPATFRHLFGPLEARGIPYYAPLLTGFGLLDFRLLAAARRSDWRRDARNGYDLLASAADEVSIVGMSFGALLAADLAAEAPVRHLVLLSPYFASATRFDRFVRRLLAIPVVADLGGAMPFFIPKPRRAGRVSNVDVLDPAEARATLHYRSMPLPCLTQFALSAAPRDLRASRARTLTVVWGGRDETSDMAAFFRALDAQGVAYREQGFAASDHGILEDFDRAEACAFVADVLADGHDA